MKTHAPWFKKVINPILRKLFNIEITLILYQGKLIGYGIRKTNIIMGREITQDELEKLSCKTLDELYESYEIKHSLTTCLYLRFNGDAEDPGELLTKEEFTKLIFDKTEWATAYESLFNYIAKEYKLKQ